ncbi:MAG: hypothetical protein HYV77_01685 [Candidatus Wildermuthbacteria bacterium]|nr:hypothetical protein [Candidatus Wildermuthbacteria bacterium]
MLWQIPVAARVATSHIVLPFLLKKIVGLPGRTTRLVWQFGLAFAFSLILVLTTGNPLFFGFPTLLLLLIGLLNSVGAYSQWRAMDVSLSKNAMLAQGDDIVALALGISFLSQERKSLNLQDPQLLFGIILTLIATLVFSWVAYRKDRNANNPSVTTTTSFFFARHSLLRTWRIMDAEWRTLLKWTLSYSVIWGIEMFLTRILAKEGVPLASFLVVRYGGSFLGSLAVRHFAGKKEAGGKLSLQGLSGILGITAVTLAIWLSALLNYAALQLTTLTVVILIYWGTEIVFPILIGLFVFKEGKTLLPVEKVVFGLALAGIVIILFAF